MAITIGGRTFRKYSDKLYINGRRVVQAFVNGVKCYPDSGWSSVRFGAAWIYDTSFEFSGAAINFVGFYFKFGSSDDVSNIRKAAVYAYTDGDTSYMELFVSVYDSSQTPRWLALVGMDDDIIYDHDSPGTTLNGGAMSYSSGGYFYANRIRNNIPSEPPNSANNLYGYTIIAGTETVLTSSAAEAIAYVTS